jgi:hypothetical protein
MFAIGLLSVVYYYYHFNKPPIPMVWPIPPVAYVQPTSNPTIPPIPVLSPTITNTPMPRINLVLEESGSPQSSFSSTWWVNSGGLMNINNNIMSTVQGDLPLTSRWYEAYLNANPVDTDRGAHPQNIFRLVSRQTQLNFQQSAYFKINRMNLSTSPNRNESNGVLLFNRYVDGNNLYYAGARVDGNLVIKKKQNGTYYTLAIKKYWPGVYNRATNPNLLPVNRFIGLKTIVSNSNGGVRIQLFGDMTGTGQWDLLLETTDTRSPITTAGFTGIRTDFMDAEFKGYSIIRNP